MIAAPEPVLPTLNMDGSRRWLRVRVSRGRSWRQRRAVAFGLIALYAALPWIRIGGRPALQLDLVHGRLFAFGMAFQPTDTVVLMLLLLVVFLAIFLLTAVAGRAWCGWACPQTVYLEFVFRPLERLLAPRPGAGPRARVVAWAALAITYGGAALLLANNFLAYFVGTDTLLTWISQSPAEHPGPFAVMAGTTGLMLFDFAHFREQMCTVACPYARLQSVLLDPDSLIIGYDARRGEPRGKLGRARGDCVDCRACVATCPTGIDIRAGLQLECIACAQCADACDAIMARLGRPPGLVGYASQRGLETGVGRRRLRPRVAIYAALLAGLVTALAAALALRQDLDAWLLRGTGAPYALTGDGRVSNQLRVRLQNRRGAPLRVELALAGGQADLALIAPENPLTLPALGQVTTSVFVLAPAAGFEHGRRTAVLEVRTSTGAAPRTLRGSLLGPVRPAGGGR